MALLPEQIESNWKKFRQLVSKTGDRADALNAMLDHFEERVMLTPASARKEFHAAYPGGLIDHSLRVLMNANNLIKAFNVKVSQESLIIAALFHDWGKVGTLTEDFYLPQDSDWHREKLGEMYKINKNIQYMYNAHRTIWLMQHFGVKLTEEEYLAILLNDGPAEESNRKYTLKEPMLATIIQQADYMATVMEKELQ